MWNSLYTRLERMAAEQPVLLAFYVFLGSMVIVIPISLPFYIQQTNEFWMNILAEAHGTVFDLLVIGWFLLWLNKIAERRLRNGRYREEIDDYLGWKSPEATHRIVGNIRRLNRGGVRQRFRLTEAFLAGANLGGAALRESDLWGSVLDNAILRDADLSGVNLAGAQLEGADLERAILDGADMRGCAMREADLERANLNHADLRGATLNAVDLQYASLKKTNLNRTNLTGANLRGSDLESANLSGANLRGANLRGANLRQADLRDADLTDADLLGVNLEGAVLPEDEDRLIELFRNSKTLFGARFTAGVEQVLYEAEAGLFQMASRRSRPRVESSPGIEEASASARD